MNKTERRLFGFHISLIQGDLCEYEASNREIVEELKGSQGHIRDAFLIIFEELNDLRADVEYLKENIKDPELDQALKESVDHLKKQASEGS